MFYCNFQLVGVRWVCSRRGCRISVPDAPGLRAESIHAICEIQGVGSRIAATLSRLGIRKCGGCARRAKTLDRLLPY